MRVPVAHHPAYVSPLPELHRFPMPKFGRLFAYLREAGLVLPQQVVVPEPAPRAWLELAHTPRYVAAVLEQRLEPAEERRLGLPMSQSLALRARCAVAGTLLAARLALEHGLACNTAGGSHHAGADAARAFASSTTSPSPPGLLDEGLAPASSSSTATSTRATAPPASSPDAATS